jgi:hypothetical protein
MPSPATWDRDVAAMLAFENDTSLRFEQRFGPQVRRTRELFELEGFTDRDLDAFYRAPANAFQIGVVATRLAVLARRLAHASHRPGPQRSASFSARAGCGSFIERRTG